MRESGLTIRKMQQSDLSFVDSLRKGENWNQTLGDLERLLAYEPEGCFIANWEGVPAGTVTTTAYGTDLGWIGMMLVHPDYRRRGIASALIQASLDYLNARNVQCIKLDATPAGAPVYQRLGFQAEWEFERWERPGSEPPKVAVSNSADFNPPASDAAIFGANRDHWLKQTAAGSFVIQEGDSFGMLRSGSRAAYLGPVVAETPAIAREIIQTLIRGCNSPIFWDVPEPNSEAVALAEEFHFQPARKLLRMWTGQKLVAGDVSGQYALVDPATG